MGLSMDLEQLTKHQIILLALLVSFVTSVATGIVTVALMSQAPPSVTRTINQIVERTVEKVVPATVGTGETKTIEKTVVVKNDDLVASSIAAAQKSIVRIVREGGTELVARGVVVGTDGSMLTDSGALADAGVSSFEAILPDGTRVAAEGVIATSSAVTVLHLALGTSTAVTAAARADTSKLQLGQSVIRIGGKTADTVGQGVIASLPGKGLVETSVSSATPGAIIITLFGEVVGMTTADSSLQGTTFYTLTDVPSVSSSDEPTAASQTAAAGATIPPTTQ